MTRITPEEDYRLAGAAAVRADLIQARIDAGMPKVRITWSNSCGPLAEVTAMEGEDAADQLAKMIRDCGFVNAGDTFKIEEID